VGAMTSKAAEARVEAAEAEAVACREETQRLRVNSDALRHDLERVRDAGDSASALVADAEKRSAAAEAAEETVARVVDSAESRIWALGESLKALLVEIPSAEAAAAANRRRPNATGKAMETANKLLAVAADYRPGCGVALSKQCQ